MIHIPPEKPQLELLQIAYAPNPAKNYMYQLLYRYIQAAKPTRSLDAGVGAMRNAWMFPGEYVGITHNRDAYFHGLQSPSVQNAIAKHGPPEVYLMRLESDFGFLAPWICVSARKPFLTPPIRPIPSVV
jgi:hypothetical protein